MSDTNDNYESVIGKIADENAHFNSHFDLSVKVMHELRDVMVSDMAKKDEEIERLKGLLKESDCVHPYSCIDFREDGDNFCKACGEKLT